jgi:hypothetical protein
MRAHLEPNLRQAGAWAWLRCAATGRQWVVRLPANNRRTALLFWQLLLTDCPILLLDLLRQGDELVFDGLSQVYLVDGADGAASALELALPRVDHAALLTADDLIDDTPPAELPPAPSDTERVISGVVIITKTAPLARPHEPLPEPQVACSVCSSTMIDIPVADTTDWYCPTCMQTPPPVHRYPDLLLEVAARTSLSLSDDGSEPARELLLVPAGLLTVPIEVGVPITYSGRPLSGSPCIRIFEITLVDET